ncbi:MAG: glycosyltransferase family 4 protein, partial [Janthinobacterium lividum]
MKEFRAFVSADTDKYHNFPRAQASFNVTVQRSFNRFRFFRKAHGHWQRGDLHVPYDTYHKLRDYSPDLILSVQLGLRTALATVYRRRHRKAKLILWATLSRHTEEDRNWIRNALRRWIVRRIDGAFVNGKGGEEYLRLLGYTGRVHTIPYAIDDAPFRSDVYDPREGVLRLIYAGHLVPQKGVRRFCTVLNEWCAAHPEIAVHLAIAGEGPEERAIRTMPAESNLSIALYRPMPQEQLATHYRQADLFVFPTLGDEWGVVVNEAMIAGLPVLGSIYSQAVLELVEEGVNGWQFDARDAKSMYAGLDRAFACGVDRLYEMSSNAQERIAQISPAAVASNAVRAMKTIAAQD